MVLSSIQKSKGTSHSAHAMIQSIIWGQWKNMSHFMDAWGLGHVSDPSYFLFSFQRLVEAAEEAHLKHEFDADLQVTS